MNCAEQFATMSLATRSKVGAAIVKDGNLVSMGWNGMPSGFPNDEIETTNADGTKTTNPLVLHAESNALMKLASNRGASSDGATLYVTLTPCRECTKLILQSGIKRVVYRDIYRDATPLQILEQAKIQLDHLPRS